MKNKPTFADRLRAIRGDRLQKDIAALLDVPYRTWVNWEVGHQIPKAYVQEMILEQARKLKPEPAKAA